MVKTFPPPHYPPRAASNRQWLWWAAFTLSCLAHALLFLLWQERVDKFASSLSAKPQTTMEVSLQTLPKAAAKPSIPESKPQAADHELAPATKPIPPPASPEPPPAQPKPEPKPPKPNHPGPARSQAKPPPQPKAAKAEPVPEFNDEFQALSHSFTSTPEADSSKQASSSPTVTADQGVQPGAIRNINPRIYYPSNARRRGMQGVVVVLIHISPDGHTDGVDLLESSGYEELDNVVLGAVQHWLFTPPTRGGMPVAGTYKHTVIFGENEDVIDDFAVHWREVKLYPSDK